MSALADSFGLGGVVAVLVIGVIAAFAAGRFLRPRHRLIWWPLIADRPAHGGVGANLYMLENSGKADADDIEVRLSFAPERVELSPAMAHGSRRDAGAHILSIARLDAGQRLGLRIEARSGEPPHVLGVAWRDGVAEQKLESWRRGAGSVP